MLRRQTDREEVGNDCLRLYIPQGYPAYSCYYHVTLSRETTAGGLLASLMQHMGLGSQRDYRIMLQRSKEGYEERLSVGDRLKEKVGSKREEGWPRLFLQPIKP